MTSDSKGSKVKASELTHVTWHREGWCDVCQRKTNWNGNAIRKECSACNEGYYFRS